MKDHLEVRALKVSVTLYALVRQDGTQVACLEEADALALYDVLGRTMIANGTLNTTVIPDDPPMDEAPRRGGIGMVERAWE